MKRVAMMLLVPTLALLVASVFEPTSVPDASAVYAAEAEAGEVADDWATALLPPPFDLVADWISDLFPGA